MPANDRPVLSHTHSLCPECLTLVPATRHVAGHDIYMKKTCPEHGESTVVLWRGDPSYQGWVRPKLPCLLRIPAQKSNEAVPLTAACVPIIASRPALRCWK